MCVSVGYVREKILDFVIALIVSTSGYPQLFSSGIVWNDCDVSSCKCKCFILSCFVARIPE
jgi:hypothetical protein